MFYLHVFYIIYFINYYIIIHYEYRIILILFKVWNWWAQIKLYQTLYVYSKQDKQLYYKNCDAFPSILFFESFSTTYSLKYTASLYIYF